jgi:hypothetical protein
MPRLPSVRLEPGRNKINVQKKLSFSETEKKSFQVGLGASENFKGHEKNFPGGSCAAQTASLASLCFPSIPTLPKSRLRSIIKLPALT